MTHDVSPSTQPYPFEDLTAAGVAWPVRGRHGLVGHIHPGLGSVPEVAPRGDCNTPSGLAKSGLREVARDLEGRP